MEKKVAEKYYTAKQVAERLGFKAPKTVYRRVSEGKLQAKKIGRSLRFSEDHIQAFLAREDQ